MKVHANGKEKRMRMTEEEQIKVRLNLRLPKKVSSQTDRIGMSANGRTFQTDIREHRARNHSEALHRYTLQAPQSPRYPLPPYRPELGATTHDDNEDRAQIFLKTRTNRGSSAGKILCCSPVGVRTASMFAQTSKNRADHQARVGFEPLCHSIIPWRLH